MLESSRRVHHLARKQLRSHYPPDFFEYTSGRFLFNEKEQKLARHVPFNPDALQKVAGDAVGAKCINLKKAHEGGFHKIFFLTFDNGREVVAKLPCPQLGSPARLTTRSEVATMEYARILGIPVPEVLTYSSDPDLDVGVEYIIMEKAKGEELALRWQESFAVKPLMIQTLGIEKLMTSQIMSQIGSIYYAKDLEPALQSRPLYSSERVINTTTDAKEDARKMEKFEIGPLVNIHHWRGLRATLDMDRGPWPDIMSYITATVRLHQRWLMECAIPRQSDDPFFRSQLDNTPSVHADYLDRYLAVIPYILPPPEIAVPMLWHNDLNGRNVFVEHKPEGPIITDIIDWHCQPVLPIFEQIETLPFIEYTGDPRIIIPGPSQRILPQLPADFDTLPAEEKALLTVDLRFATRQKAYNVLLREYSIYNAATRLWDAPVSQLPLLMDIIGQTWMDGLHHVRDKLIEIQLNWKNIAPEVPYPATPFSPQEIEDYGIEYSRRVAYETRANVVARELGIEIDGFVSNERYEEVKARSDEIQAGWNVEAMGGPYPFQDGAASRYLTGLPGFL